MEKTVIGVVIHNRSDNLIEWLRCFKLFFDNIDLFIIHNYERDSDISIYRELCIQAGAYYIQRKNIGYDIGAFQDVCKERLFGFPNDWKYLIWATDDTIPMNKNLVSLYEKIMKKENIGVGCLEISEEIKRHIRTSGFILSKEIALQLNFTEDPIISHNACWAFEHSHPNAFYEQIIGMDKKVIQLTSDIKNGYLWDIHRREYLNRWEEHYHEFPEL